MAPKKLLSGFALILALGLPSMAQERSGPNPAGEAPGPIKAVWLRLALSGEANQQAESMPFASYAEKVLDYGGIGLVKDAAERYDCILTITATAKPLGDLYKRRGSDQEPARYVTGAELAGTISLDRIGMPAAAYPFSHQEKPVEEFSEGFPPPIPYSEVFRRSFPAALISMLADMRGPEILVPFFIDCFSAPPAGRGLDRFPGLGEAAGAYLRKSGDPRLGELFAAAALKEGAAKGRVAAEAARVLMAKGDPRAAELIARAVEAGKMSIDLGIVGFLARADHPRAVEALALAFDQHYFSWDSDSRAIMHAAVKALSEKKDPAVVGIMLPILANEGRSQEVRGWAASILGATRAPSAVQPLADMLQSPESWLRAASARTLGEIRDPRALTPLVRALKDEDSDVRRSCASALGALGDRRAFAPLMLALRDRAPTVRSASRDALGAMVVSEDLAPLSKALGDPDPYVRAAGAQLLGKLDDPRATEPLLACLKDRSKEVRLAAVESLGKERGPDAEAGLAAALRDQDEDVKVAAAQAMTSVSEPKTVEALRLAARGDRGGERLPREAFEALRRTEDPRTAPAFAAMLDDGDAGLRLLAAEKLAKLGGPLAEEALFGALAKGDDAVRRSAARALETSDDPRAAKAFLAALNDSDPAVRASAEKALGAMADPRFSEDFLATALGDWKASTRALAAQALGRIGDPGACAALTLLLERDQPPVRRAAAAALASIRDPEASRRLVAALLSARQDPDPGIRSSAAKALSNIEAIDDPAAVRALLVSLPGSDPDTGRIASAALRTVRSPPAAEQLAAAGRSGNEAIRTSSASLLAEKAGSPKGGSALPASGPPPLRAERLGGISVFDDAVEFGGMRSSAPDYEKLFWELELVDSIPPGLKRDIRAYRTKRSLGPALDKATVFCALVFMSSLSYTLVETGIWGIGTSFENDAYKRRSLNGLLVSVVSLGIGFPLSRLSTKWTGASPRAIFDRFNAECAE